MYLRFDSPPSSAPRTLRLLVAPVTVAGEAAAAVWTVGAAFVEGVVVNVTFVNVEVFSALLLRAVTAKPTKIVDPIEMVFWYKVASLLQVVGTVVESLDE